MFKDRADAGKKLTEKLKRYKGKNVVILAIPNGGIEIGYEIAEALGENFSIIASLPLKNFFGSGVIFGAVSESGNFFYSNLAYDILNRFEMDKIRDIEKEKISGIIKTLRGGKPLPNLTGKTVILVDENAIFGYTLKVAIETVKAKGARKVIAVSPTAEFRAAKLIKHSAEDFISLEDFEDYGSLKEVYKEWHKLSDEEAILILERWQLLKKVQNNKRHPLEEQPFGYNLPKSLDNKITLD